MSDPQSLYNVFTHKNITKLRQRRIAQKLLPNSTMGVSAQIKYLKDVFRINLDDPSKNKHTKLWMPDGGLKAIYHAIGKNNGILMADIVAWDEYRRWCRRINNAQSA